MLLSSGHLIAVPNSMSMIRVPYANLQSQSTKGMDLKWWSYASKVHAKVYLGYTH